MVQVIPHDEFPQKEMMKSVAEISQKGSMRLQEAQARITDETMKAAYIAGYAQCMQDFGLTNESVPIHVDR